MNLMLTVAAVGLFAAPQPLDACTGITLHAADGAHVVARTIEWGGSNLNSLYVVVPRGYAQRSFTPGGQEGMRFTARYGYVGFAVEREEFVAEGLNEAGLSAGLFYFPGYGEYAPYDAARNDANIADLQLVPLVLGTVWVTVFAILFALPFGLAVAIYLSEVASEKMRKMLKPVIELLGGIPSVVYGFFGLIVIVPLLQDVFGLPVGESGLAGALVLAIMALPTIITVSQDAMLNCPRAQREASLALGASKWQTIYKVVMPYSASGITSAVVLGIGRAFGETMAVLMVTGNAAVIPLSITDPLRTIPATIAAELGEAPAGGPHYQSLFLLGVVLFFITLLINSSVEYISARNKK